MFQNYPAYFLLIESTLVGKNGFKTITTYHIPQDQVKQFLTMSSNFNKKTFMEMAIPTLTVFHEKGKNATLENFYDMPQKIYTDKGKLYIEWMNKGTHEEKEFLSFDQSVLLQVWGILLQQTIY